MPPKKTPTSRKSSSRRVQSGGFPKLWYSPTEAVAQNVADNVAKQIKKSKDKNMFRDTGASQIVGENAGARSTAAQALARAASEAEKQRREFSSDKFGDTVKNASGKDFLPVQYKFSNNDLMKEYNRLHGKKKAGYQVEKPRYEAVKAEIRSRSGAPMVVSDFDVAQSAVLCALLHDVQSELYAFITTPENMKDGQAKERVETAMDNLKESVDAIQKVADASSAAFAAKIKQQDAAAAALPARKLNAAGNPIPLEPEEEEKVRADKAWRLDQQTRGLARNVADQTANSAAAVAAAAAAQAATDLQQEQAAARAALLAKPGELLSAARGAVGSAATGVAAGARGAASGIARGARGAAARFPRGSPAATGPGSLAPGGPGPLPAPGGPGAAPAAPAAGFTPFAGGAKKKRSTKRTTKKH